MPFADVVAAQKGADPMSDGDAPKDMNAPTGQPEPTTMNTPDMIPPYIHNQTVGNRSAYVLFAMVLGITQLLKRFV